MATAYPRVSISGPSASNSTKYGMPNSPTTP